MVFIRAITMYDSKKKWIINRSKIKVQIKNEEC
jgi:hypothetical protein